MSINVARYLHVGPSGFGAHFAYSGQRSSGRCNEHDQPPLLQPDFRALDPAALAIPLIQSLDVVVGDPLSPITNLASMAFAIQQS